MRYIIREKLFRLTEDSVIQDEQGAPIYQVKGKIFSLHHTLVLMDLAGWKVPLYPMAQSRIPTSGYLSVPKPAMLLKKSAHLHIGNFAFELRLTDSGS